jgi:hypothetical protein
VPALNLPPIRPCDERTAARITFHCSITPSTFFYKLARPIAYDTRSPTVKMSSRLRPSAPAWYPDASNSNFSPPNQVAPARSTVQPSPEQSEQSAFVAPFVPRSDPSTASSMPQSSFFAQEPQQFVPSAFAPQPSFFAPEPQSFAPSSFAPQHYGPSSFEPESPPVVAPSSAPESQPSTPPLYVQEQPMGYYSDSGAFVYTGARYLYSPTPPNARLAPTPPNDHYSHMPPMQPNNQYSHFPPTPPFTDFQADGGPPGPVLFSSQGMMQYVPQQNQTGRRKKKNRKAKRGKGKGCKNKQHDVKRDEDNPGGGSGEASGSIACA